MFKFFKKKDTANIPEKQSKKAWDKVLMGAVIGGAIGSVIGATIAPKKGKETRDDIVDIAKKAKKSSGIFFRRFKKMLKIGKENESSEQITDKEEAALKIPHENK